MSIVKSNVTEQIIEYLKNNIENGNWKLGEKVPSENQLTEILGVSRASIRVAIQQLIAIGVLESFQGKGTYVKNTDINARSYNPNSITKEDCKDISKVLEFRRIVETEACYLAVPNIDEEIIEKLRNYLTIMSKNIGNPIEFIKADRLYHEEICKASGNQLLGKSLKDVFNKTEKSHKQINKIFGYNDGIYYHKAILRAIEDRDAERARQLMYEHLQQAIDRLEVD
ncbi:MAG TPA: FadR family transcriptional regulator [Tepidimicrobium sp.]|nr:FadR family transcriptional regulator [Tepidimicrobium sp.]